MEGVFESQSCAPLYVVGWVNESDETTRGIKVPCLLSLLAYQDSDATVTGLEAFPEENWAPVNVVFQVYHVMFDLGGVFALLALVALGAWFWKRKVFQWRWLLWVFVISIVLTEVATLAGWWTAEIGRQPWIVWNVLRTSDAVSPTLSTGEVAASLTMFAVLYALLFALFIFLLNRVIQEGPRPLEEEHLPESLPDTFREVFRRARASAAGE
jgi:cytochrome d ubiquinol oxidase subunit I